MKRKLDVRKLLGTWRRRLLFGVVALLLVAWLVIDPFSAQQANPAEPVTGVSLQAEKKVYQLGEAPALLLHFRHASKQTGFLQRILSPNNVYAAGMPKVTVDYDGHAAADVTSSVMPKGDDFLVTLASQRQLKPGTYTVSASGQTTSGQHYNKSTTFAWGVLAVNTTKSIYLPGETADLQMGVLDSDGHTICGAPLRLSITDPAGNQQTVPYQASTSCKGDSFTNTPDYTAVYKTGAAGQYKITLGIQNTAYAITSYFEVRAHVPFDITRSAVTRIYPIHPYGMSIEIKANQNFQGIATEAISDNRFTILQHPGATVQKKGNETILQWQVNWRKGSAYDLSYEYLGPPVSPAFYTLGPLTLTNTNGQIVFQEARAWQLAGDAAISLVNEWEWDCGGALTCNAALVTTSGYINPTQGPLNPTPTTTGNGDTLILLEGNSGTSNGANLQSVTDSSGNTWHTPVTPTSQSPPANFNSGESSVIAMAYANNATSISSLTATIASSHTMSVELLDFSNVDNVIPLDQSASTKNSSSVSTHTTPSVPVTTCDSPTTSMLLRGGEYFCQSVNELVIGMVNAGAQTGGDTLITSGFTGVYAMTQASDNEAGAYEITPTSVPAGQSISWTSLSNKGDATGIIVFRQNGNTSGGDAQPFFWAH
ncbi:MAG TPA: hypothetical protein VGG13_03120 [Candidatus Saccharimonadales bacterium]|jgi:hypothetical protein